VTLVPDGGDALAAERDQVRGRVPGRGHVIDPHVIEGAIGDVLAQQDHGNVARVPAELGFTEAQRAEDQAVEQVAARVLVQELAFPGRVAVGLLDHHRVGMPARLGDDEPGQLGKVGHAQLRHGQADHPGPAPAEVTRHQVGLVTELLDGPLDALAQLVRDERELVDDVRHRPG
jgi:hypothetical protein